MVPILFGDSLLNIQFDLPPIYIHILAFILKDYAITILLDFPKDESWKELPNPIKDRIDEKRITPRGVGGYNIVLDAGCFPKCDNTLISKRVIEGKIIEEVFH